MKFSHLIVACIVSFILLSHHCYASKINTKQIKITVMDKNMDAYYFIPWNENESKYSGIGFKKTVEYEDKPITGFKESRIASTTEENVGTINFLCMNSGFKTCSGSGYSLGLISEYSDIRRKDFGYFQYKPDDNGPWVATDNQVDIFMVRPGFNGALWVNAFDGRFKALAGANVYPSAWIDVKQDTRAKPLADENGRISNAEFQKPGAAVAIDMDIDTGWGFHLTGSVFYEHLPMKYKVSALTADIAQDVFLFTPQNISLTEKTFYYEFKVRLSKDIYSLHPTIGIRSETLKTDGNVDLPDSRNSHNTIFGLEGKF